MDSCFSLKEHKLRVLKFYEKLKDCKRMIENKRLSTEHAERVDNSSRMKNVYLQLLLYKFLSLERAGKILDLSVKCFIY